ncbi:hypothetical protein [Hydrogenophaga sp.]|uniref:hypothetical protein n=1 Tax=Hydrogenophaga sp. TaxID=1904254 RepID=UPI002619514D|nr:hypothetical protein [Hydrogenophaga sp.]
MASRTTTSSSKVGSRRESRLGPGQAPPVGLENARQARENIEIKIHLLDACITAFNEGDAAEHNEWDIGLGALPRSQRAFNSWQSSELSDVVQQKGRSFTKNGNATLLKNKDLFDRLREYLDILKKLDEAKPSKKTQSLISLQRRLSIEKNLRHIAEVELARSRSQLWLGHKEIERLRAALNSAVAKAKEEIGELNIQLQQLVAERAELAGALKKVTGIRRVQR